MIWPIISSPVQVSPSPVYPVLQEQLKDPTVFPHIAFASHRLTEKLHSSASEMNQRGM